MYAVREEKVISGGLEFTKRTEVIGTNEGFVALETRTLEAQQPQQPAGPTFLPITAGPPVVVVESPPEPKPCCDYGCCECDDNFKWNSFYGKGAGVIILLILMYLIGFVLCVAFIVIIIALAIVVCFCGDDDND